MRGYLEKLSNPRLVVVLMMGFASGLPLPLSRSTLSAWMTSENISLSVVGFFWFVGIPYTYKFLWAPFLDRYRPPFLGRRTSWMLPIQIVLALAIAVMGLYGPHGSLAVFAFLAVTVSFLGASQDIVIDAYRADILRDNELGKGAGFAVTGARLALLISGGGALILSDYMPWSGVYLVMAGMLLLCAGATSFAPEPEVATAPPATLQAAVVDPFRAFFRRNYALVILLFIILYKLCDAVAGAMTTPFLIKMEYSRSAIGTMNKLLGTGLTIVGALWGGWIVERWGIWRTLLVFGVLQAISNLAFIPLALSSPKLPLLAFAVATENLAGGMGGAAFTVFLIKLCDKEFSATQFALFTSIMAFTAIGAGGFSGVLAERLGWVNFFAMTAFLAIPSLLILIFARKAFDRPSPLPFSPPV